MVSTNSFIRSFSSVQIATEPERYGKNICSDPVKFDRSLESGGHTSDVNALADRRPSLYTQTVAVDYERVVDCRLLLFSLWSSPRNSSISCVSWVRTSMANVKLCSPWPPSKVSAGGFPTLCWRRPMSTWTRGPVNVPTKRFVLFCYLQTVVTVFYVVVCYQ